VLVVERQAQEIYLELVEPVLVLELDWAISTFSEITLNSNNFDKLFNKTLKCSSLSFNKLELETHNWLL
jgi:hypothetical protein